MTDAAVALQATILLFLVASPVLRRVLRAGGRHAGSTGVDLTATSTSGEAVAV